MNVTAKIKITPTPEIVKTLKIYSKGLQLCIDIAWKKRIKNNVKLHPFVYRRLRSLGLPSQLAIACIKQACGMVKKAKSKPIINRTSIRYNFPRSASLKEDILSISTIAGRQKCAIVVPKCFKDYFATWQLRESLLKIDKRGKCFFYFTFINEIKSPVLPNKALGIDLGINNLAVTSDNRFFNSGKTKHTKRKFAHLRSKLQAKGTRSAKRLLKRISGREKRFMAWVNHNISKRIVTNFDGNRIYMENLKGIRKKKEEEE